MIQSPIYKPKGRALEYSPDALACNIYTGCPHRCYYCFAPGVLRKDREAFHSCVEPRNEIVESVKRQIEREHITDKLIHLCFTCDPYPVGYDTTPTREIIKAIKDSGNHVQILTKGDMAERDFDLLDGNDWFGVTVSGAEFSQEPGAEAVAGRLRSIQRAKERGIKTWVSCEPVINTERVYRLFQIMHEVDLFRIGKLNYHPSDIDWAAFGRECVRLCEQYGRNYYIKHDLREVMNGAE